MTQTSLVVLTYNCLRYTQACLESIRQFTHTPYELIVVDNGSQDGTSDYLRKQQAVRLIANLDNKGYSHGNNQGMQSAQGDFILLLNNDVIVTEDWLSRLLSHFDRNPKLGLIGPRTNQISGSQKLELSYDPWDMETIQRLGQERYLQYHHQLSLTRRVAGFCMLFRRSVMEQIGYLDEQFGTGNFEDDDYCKRAHLSGFHIGIAEDVFVHHFGSVSFLENKVDYQGQMRKNQDVFVRKWGEADDYYEFSRPEVQRLLPHQFHKVLDIGCGAGAFGKALKERDLGAYVVGIESEPTIAKKAESYLDHVICADIETLQMPCESFDCIVFNDCLEHLVDPWQVLKKCTPILKEDGIVIASIPNFRHFSVLKKWVSGNWWYEKAGILDQTHLRFFTFQSIQHLFEEAGLTLDAWRSVPLYPDEENESEQFSAFEAALVANGLSTRELAADMFVYQFIVIGGHQKETERRRIRYQIKKPAIYWRNRKPVDAIEWIVPPLNVSTTNSLDRNITLHAEIPEKIHLPTSGTLINIARLGPLCDLPLSFEGLERLKNMDDVWVVADEDKQSLKQLGLKEEAIFVLPVLQSGQDSYTWGQWVLDRLQLITIK